MHMFLAPASPTPIQRAHADRTQQTRTQHCEVPHLHRCQRSTRGRHARKLANWQHATRTSSSVPSASNIAALRSRYHSRLYIGKNRVSRMHACRACASVSNNPAATSVRMWHLSPSSVQCRTPVCPASMLLCRQEMRRLFSFAKQSTTMSMASSATAGKQLCVNPVLRVLVARWSPQGRKKVRSMVKRSAKSSGDAMKSEMFRAASTPNAGAVNPHGFMVTTCLRSLARNAVAHVLQRVNCQPIL